VAFKSIQGQGVLYTKSGNNQLLYMGVQDQCYTFTMFDAQAQWTVKYLLGNIEHVQHDPELEQLVPKLPTHQKCS
jgi:hypothetical protein